MPFDAIEVLVALAIEQRQQEVVVEFELAACGRGFADDFAGRGAHAAHSSFAVGRAMMAPARLFGAAA